MQATPEVVLTAFRKCFLWDATVARPAGVDVYLALFPGFEREIAAEYDRLAADVRVAHGAPAPAERPVVGPYRLERFLGRGGQGAVYAATDTRDGRTVALKTLAAAAAMSPRRRLRLQREAEAIARIDHPGICGIHEACVDGDVPYLALRYVEGRTLAETIRDARGRTPSATGTAEAAATLGLPANGESALARVARFFEDAARAVHAAHEAGLVHRDVKPANLMVTPAGDPVVLDFGVARDEDEGATITMTGALLGTPAYMAPEQILADGARIDRRVDVYALGLCLFEALTLVHPFEAPTAAAARRASVVHEARNLRDLDERFPADLALIVQTALRSDRDLRYATASALADDLSAFRLGRPIAARPPGPWRRLRAWSRRNPALAASSALAFVSLAGGLGVSLHLLAARTDALKTTTAARASEAKSRQGAIELIAYLLGPLNRQLSSVGRSDVLADVARTAKTYFDSIPVEDLSDDELATVADAWANLGVAFELQAHHEEQQRCWDKTLELRTALFARHPGDPSYQDGFANALRAMARRQQVVGQFENSIATYRRSDELVATLSRPYADDVTVGLEHSNMLRGLGVLERRVGRMDDALATLQRAVEIGEAAVARAADRTRPTVEAAYASFELAVTFDTLGRSDDARRRADEALARMRGLFAEHSDNTYVLDVLATVLIGRSWLSQDRGDLDDSVAAAHEAQDLYRRLRGLDPQNNRWRNIYVTATARVASAHAGRGDTEEALQAGREAGDVASAVAGALSPTQFNPDSHTEIARMLRTHAAVLRLAGRTDDALARLAEGSKCLDRALAEPNPDLNVQFEIVAHRQELGATLADAADRARQASPAAVEDLLTRALAAFDEADAAARRVIGAHPEYARFARQRALVLRDTARARTAAGDLRGAVVVLEQAVRVRDELAAEPSFKTCLNGLDALLADARDRALRGAAAR